MPPRQRLACVATSVLVLVPIACGDDDSGNADASSSVTTASATGNPSTSESASSGSADADTSATETGNDTASDTTDSPPNLGICESYIACAMETMPEVIASIIATYGAEGSCWMLPGVTEADCWTECDAQMSNLRDANPEIESCWECTSDAECTEVPWCDLVAHECVDDLIFCDAIVDTGQCFERPAHLGLPCGDTYPTEPGHCPVNAALLGTCIGAFPDGLIYYYEPLWALPGAHDACAEDDGVLRPGPP